MNAVVRLLALAKPPSANGWMQDSAPPATITSASPQAIKRDASPMECAPVVQAVVTVWFGPCSCHVSYDHQNTAKETNHEAIFHRYVTSTQVDQQLRDKQRRHFLVSLRIELSAVIYFYIEQSTTHSFIICEYRIIDLIKVAYPRTEADALVSISFVLHTPRDNRVGEVELPYLPSAAQRLASKRHPGELPQ